jgi:hypothetical protein
MGIVGVYSQCGYVCQHRKVEKREENVGVDSRECVWMAPPAVETAVIARPGSRCLPSPRAIRACADWRFRLLSRNGNTSLDDGEGITKYYLVMSQWNSDQRTHCPRVWGCMCLVDNP